MFSLSKFLKLFLCFAVVKTVGLLKISYMVGSHHSFFSMSSGIMPLAGAFGGIIGSCAFFALHFFTKFLYGQINPFIYLVYHIPGLCASFYWCVSPVLMRVLVPTLCMLLFVMHPVGVQAFPYALYWFIPIILYCIGRKTIFLEALGSTFIAHAVGSVIWLYTMPMTVDMWWILIPIVALERLLFASSMAMVYKIINWCTLTVKKTVLIFYAYLANSRRDEKI